MLAASRQDPRPASKGRWEVEISHLECVKREEKQELWMVFAGDVFFFLFWVICVGFSILDLFCGSFLFFCRPLDGFAGDVLIMHLALLR